MKDYSNIEDLKLLSESALESSLAGYWDWDMVTNEEYLSPRFKEMFGYKDHEMENVPESWQKIAFQEDLPGIFEDFNAHVESRGKIPFNSVIRYHHKNGKTIWVRCTGKVVKWSDDGKPLRTIGCHVDITEEKEKEIQLQQAIKDREILLKEVHHRVKNNLQLLLSLSRLKDNNGAVQTSEIEASVNSISKAYEAIYKSNSLDQILMHEYLDQIIQPILFNKGIDFKLEYESISQRIDDLIPVGLIMTELVNNTIKYAFLSSENRTIWLTISKDDTAIIILFSDNGKGYGTSFDSTVDNGNSMGIGIMKGLAEQLSGTIRFFNDNGACAELKIPNTTASNK